MIEIKKSQIKKIQEAVGSYGLEFAEGHLEVSDFNGLYTLTVIKSGNSREICKVNGATKVVDVAQTSNEVEAQKAIDFIIKEFSF